MFTKCLAVVLICLPVLVCCKPTEAPVEKPREPHGRQEPLNQIPIATYQSITTAEDYRVEIILGGSDADGNVLEFELVSEPSHGTLSGTLPNLVYTPAAEYVGPDTFAFRTNDGNSDSEVAHIDISVVSVNDTPVASDYTFTLDEDTLYGGSLVGSDVDEDALTFVTTQPNQGTLVLNSSTGQFSYTPFPNTNGSDEFRYRVFDGAAFSPFATVTIQIAPINDVPIARDSSFTVWEDTSQIAPVLVTDADFDIQTVSIVANPNHGTVVITDLSTVTYTPNPNYTGADSFTFRVDDGSGFSNVATSTVTVVPVNDPPVADSASFSVVQGGTKGGVLSGSDALDGSSVTFHLVSNPSKGTVQLLNSGEFLYSSSSSSNGSDSFAFRVFDGSLYSEPTTVHILVTGTPGAFDFDFGRNGISVTNQVEGLRDMVLQPDGKIVATGRKTVRFLPDGSLDESFGFNGIQDVAGYHIKLQSDGHLVVAGEIAGGAWGMRRLTGDGLIDPNFGDNGIKAVPVWSGREKIEIVSNDKVLVISYSELDPNNSFQLFRFNSDGSSDLDFGSGGRKFVCGLFLTSMAPVELIRKLDGKILIIGESHQYIGGFRKVIRQCQIDENGLIDSSFGQNGIVEIADAMNPTSALLDKQGRVIVAGNIYDINAKQHIVTRLDVDGSVDASFNQTGRIVIPLDAFVGLKALVSEQQDGKLLVGGALSSNAENNPWYFSIFRFNENGTLDTSFGTNGRVWKATSHEWKQTSKLLIQSNGRILIGGNEYHFNPWGMTSWMGIVRLWP